MMSTSVSSMSREGDATLTDAETEFRRFRRRLRGTALTFPTFAALICATHASDAAGSDKAGDIMDRRNVKGRGNETRRLFRRLATPRWKMEGCCPHTCS